MSNKINTLFLYSKLIWNHIVYWTFPTLGETYYSNLGTIYFNLGKYKEAILAFLKSEDSHNHQDISYSKYNLYYLSYSYLNRGNFKKAADNFKNYFKFEREDCETLSIIGWCHGMLFEPEKALGFYQSASELDPNNPALDIACAEILYDQTRSEEALVYFERARNKSQDEKEKRLIDLFIQIVKGDPADIVNFLKEESIYFATHKDQTGAICHEDYLIFLARYLRKFGDPKEALLLLEDASKLSPDDLWLMNELAMEYADQGIKLGKALKIINHALKLQPDNSNFIDTKGWVLLKLGKIKTANKEFHKSLHFNPQNKDAKEHLSIINDG